MNKKVFVFLLIPLSTAVALAAVYKWTDDAGNTHYSERPPGGPAGHRELSIRSGSDVKQQERTSVLALPSKVRSLPLSKLGPLPDNSVSKYLYTKASGLAITDIENKLAMFSVTLGATPLLPHRAYLVVNFENPENANAPLIVEIERQFRQDEFLIESPALKSPKCWNYMVSVKIYRDKSKQVLVGEHRQYIQSRMNLDKTDTYEDVLDAARTGRCP